jgi:hypothetical protein
MREKITLFRHPWPELRTYALRRMPTGAATACDCFRKMSAFERRSAYDGCTLGAAPTASVKRPGLPARAFAAPTPA